VVKISVNVLGSVHMTVAVEAIRRPASRNLATAWAPPLGT